MEKRAIIEPGWTPLEGDRCDAPVKQADATDPKKVDDDHVTKRLDESVAGKVEPKKS